MFTLATNQQLFHSRAINCLDSVCFDNNVYSIIKQFVKIFPAPVFQKYLVY